MEMRELIGFRIKELREYYFLSQSELSEGICTQAYISKIENGTIAIAADILYMIAEKFGVDINYFFDSSYNLRFDYVLEMEVQARELVETRDFESLQRLIQLEEKSPLNFNRRFKQFIQWHKALCVRYLDNDYAKSLALLDEALTLCNTSRKTYSEREIEIVLNKGNIYIDLQKYEKAIDIYTIALKALKKIPAINDPRIEIRLLYNIARAFLMLNNYDQSINYATQAVNSCKKHKLLYGLGQAYFLLGRGYQAKEMYEESKKSLEKALSIFDLIEFEEFQLKTKRQIEKLDKLYSHQ